MAHYRYRGRNHQGQLETGVLDADNENAVAVYLSGNGITPIDIAPAPAEKKAGLVWSGLKSKPKINLLDLIFFSRQMYTLLRSGVPILDALQGLRESTPSDGLATVIGAIRDGLDSGQDLSNAIRQHPDVFPSLYVSIIEIGEASGTLAESFLQLVSYLEQERETRNRIRSAMRYPLIVIGAIAAALVIINIFVIPAFAQLFSRFNAELPLPTRILIASSSFTLKYWPLLVFAAVSGVFGAKRHIRTTEGRMRWHRYKLKMPIIGGIIYRATLGRFAHALSICIKSGVPWGQGMMVVGNAVDNVYIAEKVRAMRDGVERGESITRTAAATGLFPPLVIQMIGVGEQTGALDHLLNEVAEYYEREVEYQLKHLSTAIEPVLLGAVGVIVLILALGVFMPMWGLASAALHH